MKAEIFVWFTAVYPACKSIPDIQDAFNSYLMNEFSLRTSGINTLLLNLNILLTWQIRDFSYIINLSGLRGQKKKKFRFK